MADARRFYVDIMAMHVEVTGSCILLIVKFPDGETKRYVVDCGLFHEKEYLELNSELLFYPENIDACFLTHVHVDHVGKLPFIVRNGYFNEIYTTTTTCKLLPLALRDSCKVLRSVSKRRHEKPLYSENDVENTLHLLKPCNYETITVDENLKVTFIKNGHIAGSALILFQFSYMEYEDINILFTGDFNNKNKFFDVDPIPDWIKELPLTVIQEATYGDMNSTQIEKTFKNNVQSCIDNEGTVIAMVYSLGRTQEILYEIKVMQDLGEIDSQIPIYLDGNLAIAYTHLFINDGVDINPEMKDFLPQNLTFVTKANRSEVLADTNKKIVLTSAGSGSYGPATEYIPQYITRSDALIQFTGFTPEGTLGSELKNTGFGEMVKIGGMFVQKRARVEYTTEFSAHAKADEMIEFLKQFKNLKLVLVNHGEAEVQKIFAERILKEVDPKGVGLLDRDYFFRINTWGVIKTLPTKFK